jgi:uncharacterized repeat protein (TIGR01451 family)
MRIPGLRALVSLSALLLVAAVSVQAQGQPDIFNVEVKADDPGAGDLFGCALSLSREGTLVIGSVLDEEDDDPGTDLGSIYVFGRQGGRFKQTAKKRASDGAAGHRLGFSVSIDRDGSRFAAGALAHDAAGENAGAAYVFRREGAGWIEEDRLIPDAVGPFDQLGHSIALSGDVLAVGAPGDDTRADAAGTVYVYERGADGWALAAMLTAAEGDNVGDGLGYAVALDGDTLLAGAPFADDGFGAVHVFVRGPGGWQQVQRLTAPEPHPGALFGAALSLDGDRAALGARLDDGAGDRAGAAWVFRRSGGVWQVEQQLPSPEIEPGDEFGISVALDGDALAVGARFANLGAHDTGAVYRYRRRGSQWRFEQRLEAAVPAAGDELGFAVAVEDMEGAADDLVIAGAYRADSEAGPDSGLARLRVEGRNADLTITKSNGRETAATRDELVYEIRVRNLGPADVGEAEGGAHVTDTFPAGLSDCAWTCAAVGAGASCATPSARRRIDALVSLPAGTSALFEATCTVAAAAGATITNLARVEPPEEVEDPDLDNNEAVDETRITGVPEPSFLTITKSGPATGAVGGTLPYTVEVTNQGPGAAPGSRVTDPLPALPSSPLDCTWTCAGASCARPGPVEGEIDELPTLPAGATVTYSAQCKVPCNASGTLTNEAIALGPDNQASATVTTTVTAADLRVEVLVEATDLPASTVRIQVENQGTATAEDAVLDLGLSAPVGFTEITDLCDGSFPCPLGTLEPGEVRRIDLQLTPDCGDPVTEVELTATATLGGPCPATARDTAILALEPITDCPVNLRVLKGATSAVVGSGGPAMFTVQVSNEGPQTALARVHDPIQAGLLGASAKWTCTASPGATCTAEGDGDIDDEVTLPPGATVTYSLMATIASDACGPVTNTAFANVVPPNVDTQPGDNSSSVSFFAVPVNGTCAVKTVFPKAQIEGGQITYSIVVVHGGPGTLGGPGVELEDVVPSGLTVVAVGADQGTATFVGSLVTWDGTLDPGESVTITITATVDIETLGQVICNQGLVFPNLPTDDPGVAGTEDPTCLAVVAFIPTLSPVWMGLLAVLLGALGLAGLHRRRSDRGARNGSTPPPV